MEQEEVLREDSDSPHFGDEQTLRDAQPVVPLAEIRSNHVRNRLLMSLALVIALGLGAGGALLLVQFKRTVGDESSTSKPGRNNPTTGEDPSVAAVGEEATGEEEEMIDAARNEDSTPEGQSIKKARRKRISHVASSDINAPSTTAVVVNSSATPVAVKTEDVPKRPILVDQWEEKRSRRVNPNEPARANVRRRDLFRIRDIFEGARP